MKSDLKRMSVSSETPRQRVPLTIWLLAVVIAVLLGTATVLRHRMFLSSAFDLGFYGHAAWAIAHGEWTNSVSGAHVFADHFSPLLILLAPLAFLGDTVAALLVVQAIAVGSTVIPAFRLGQRLGGERLGWICAVWIGLSANVWHTVMFDFRPSNLGYVALIWLIAELESRERTWVGVGLAVVAVSSREDVAVFTGLALLIHGFLTRERRWIIWGSIAVGIGVWYITLGQQLFSPFEYFMWYRFADYGSGPFEALVNPSYAIPTALTRLLRPEVLLAFGALLVPLLVFPPLRGWKWTWPGLAIMVGNGISVAAFIPTIYYQYYILSVAFLSWGAAHALVSSSVLLHWRPIAYWSILVFLFTGPILSYGSSPYGRTIQDVAVSTDRSVIGEELPVPPTDESVSAGTALLPHLVERHDVYLYPLPLVCGEVVQAFVPQTSYPEWVLIRPNENSLDLRTLGYEQIQGYDSVEVWRSSGRHPEEAECPEPNELRSRLFDRVKERAGKS